jgi:hypothetical protein
MAQHLLDDLHVGAGGDREARRRVAEDVWGDALEADLLGCGIEVPVAEVEEYSQPPSGDGNTRRPPPASSRCTSANGKWVAPLIRTQPGRFSLAGEGLSVGKDGGEAVTSDYPGTSPCEFTGGEIRRAVVDVSGEPFIDLAKEAHATMLRE